MNKVLALIGCVFFLFASCKKGKEQAPAHFITADIDGTAVSFNTNNVARFGTGLYLYGAAAFDLDAPAIAINISLKQPLAMTTYNGSADDSQYVGISYLPGPFSADQSNEYISDFSDPGVAIKITSLTNDNVQGTFRGTLSQNGKTKSITNGKFNLNITQ